MRILLVLGCLLALAVSACDQASPAPQFVGEWEATAWRYELSGQMSSWESFPRSYRMNSSQVMTWRRMVVALASDGSYTARLEYAINELPTEEASTTGTYAADGSRLVFDQRSERAATGAVAGDTLTVLAEGFRFFDHAGWWPYAPGTPSYDLRLERR